MTTKIEATRKRRAQEAPAPLVRPPSPSAAATVPLLDAARESQTDIREAATAALKQIQAPESTPAKP